MAGRLRIYLPRSLIWAKVALGQETTQRQFLLIGTGHPLLRNDLNFIGTVQIRYLGLVWHIFEVMNP